MRWGIRRNRDRPADLVCRVRRVYPAAATHAYPLFLSSLFVLASGITFLQVAANPYVTILGPARRPAVA